jgi:DNA repair protein RecO (recombination protein O)
LEKKEEQDKFKMFIKHRTEGIIFKKENLGESDQLFKVFTNDFGKIEILGKGIRKISSKLRSQIDIFYLSEIEFVQGKIHKRLTDALLIEKFKNLRKSLKRLSIAYKISEVLEGLIKGEEKDERIWNLILETFKNLDDPNLQFKICNLQFYYFFWNLVSILGEKPELYFCCICQRKLKPGKVYFSEKEGGTICPICFQRTKEGREISQNSVKILRIILEKDFDFLKKLKIREKELEELSKISNSYFRFLTENEAKFV